MQHTYACWRPRFLWMLQLGCLIAVLSGMAFIPNASSAETPPARVIIKWRPADGHTRSQAMTAVRADFQHATGLKLTPHHALSERLDVMTLAQPLSQQAFTQALTALRAQPEVEYAVADERRYIASLPSDPLLTATSGRSGQWYLLNTEPAAINAYGAWDYSHGGAIGAGVVVAVMDTGVRFDHPDLAGKLLSGYDFVSCDQTNCTGTGQTFLTANDGNGWDADASDPGDWVSTSDLQNHSDVFPSSRCSAENSSWHGTRVAGIIGAATDNGVGIAGAGWNARILPVRVLGKCGGYDSDIIAGVRWAAGLDVGNGVPINRTPAKVINLSLGGTGACTQAYVDVISTLTAMNISIVASAGNDSAILNTPANCSGVISVVGVRNTGTKVGFSSLGAATIAAPAGNCVSANSVPCLYSIDSTTNLGTTSPGTNDYTDQTNYNIGTSFSAPIVSGTIALMLGANASLTPTQINSALRSSATPFPQTASATCQVPTSSTAVSVNQAECNCTANTCGAGIVNALQAVLAVSASSSSSSSSTASSYSSSSSASLSSVSSSTSSSSAASVSSSSSTSSSSVTTTPSSSGGGGATSLLEMWSLIALGLVRRRHDNVSRGQRLHK